MSVRDALGDKEATALGKKRGVPGKLSLLKAMVNECENFMQFPLTIYFLNEVRRQEFLSASYSKEHDCVSTRPTIHVDSLEEMPFWVKRSTRKGTGRKGGQKTGSKVSAATAMDHTTVGQGETDKRRCYTCNFTAAEDETTIVCDQCSSMFHEFCLEGLALGGGSSNCNINSKDTEW